MTVSSRYWGRRWCKHEVGSKINVKNFLLVGIVCLVTMQYYCDIISYHKACVEWLGALYELLSSVSNELWMLCQKIQHQVLYALKHMYLPTCWISCMVSTAFSVEWQQQETWQCHRSASHHQAQTGRYYWCPLWSRYGVEMDDSMPATSGDHRQHCSNDRHTITTVALCKDVMNFTLNNIWTSNAFSTFNKHFKCLFVERKMWKSRCSESDFKCAK